MEKEYGTVTFLNSIEDTFPYIESTVMILDNNFNWWKKNYEKLESLIANEARGFSDKNVEIETRFIIYNGQDENVEMVKWSGPAIEFTFVESSSSLIDDIKKSIGNIWEGHKVITYENRLIVMIE